MSNSPSSLLYKDELLELLATLARPIDFASKNNFAFLSMVKDFESFTEEILTALRGIKSLPKDISEQIDKLVEAFSGFDVLSDDLKKERLLRAVEVMGFIRVFLEGGEGVAPKSVKKSTAPASVVSHKESSDRIKKLSTPL
ncbi:MAG: hypothetical protein KAS88_06560, partial [Deltaproteobacteria bacterium]|nr:hypothetical protein [Deltaproteobacteria bacterium]